VEVIVATTILAIGLLAVLTAFSLAARVSGASNADTKVALLAQQKFSEIEVQDPQRLSPGTTSGTFSPSDPDYGWQLTIHQQDSQHVTQVDLTIYAPQAGKTREVRFTTSVF
jgi:Tfp pilus assembly protein PilV